MLFLFFCDASHAKRTGMSNLSGCWPSQKVRSFIQFSIYPPFTAYFCICSRCLAVMVVILQCLNSGSNPDRLPFRCCDGVCANCLSNFVCPTAALTVTYVHVLLEYSYIIWHHLILSFSVWMLGSSASAATPMSRVVVNDHGSSSDDAHRKL
jgi:hypothetical protein